jgi:hypothetical protein
MIKKSWREILMWVMGGVIIFQFQTCQNQKDKILAGEIAAKANAALTAKLKAISHDYAKLQLEVDKQIADSHATISEISAKADKFYADSKAAQAKIKQMQSVNDQLQATNYELELCQRFMLKQKDDYTLEIKKRDDLWCSKFDLKVNECAAKETLLTNRVVNMTNTLAWYAVKDKRRWVFGPSIGYGVQGLYVGVGLTFRIFEFSL